MPQTAHLLGTEQRLEPKSSRRLLVEGPFVKSFSKPRGRARKVLRTGLPTRPPAWESYLFLTITMNSRNGYTKRFHC